MRGTIGPTTRLKEALDLDPRVAEYVISLNPHDFERLRNPLMRRLMAPRITPRGWRRWPGYRKRSC